jgi:very-short-patch-repair endonuclease/DNA polymerase III delta prime subunit
MPFDPDARLAEWRKSLLDISKRNRLIKFAAGRGGGAYLLRPTVGDLWGRLVCEGGRLTFARKAEILGLPAEVLNAESLGADFDPQSGSAAGADVARELTDMCLLSPNLLSDHLLTEFTDRQLAARLTRLFRTAREGATDHGVTTLFAAFGFLRWFESPDSIEEVLSPLLLVPVRLERETVESPFTLRAEDEDVVPNHCLAELLRTQFRIKLPTAAECPLGADDPQCVARYVATVAAAVAHVPRWGVVESAAVGVFNFQKLAMWEDLGRNAARVTAHPVCRAIAGDGAVSLAPPADLPHAADLDRVVPPAAAVHILDADSSQHEAIEAVKRGAHLVMDGPPGTGKSQTIANMIAELLRAEKTVLFVSEKTAALEVVKRRLDRSGLGDYCLELHSAKANKRAVLDELGRCLDLPVVAEPDNAGPLGELGAARRALNEFVAELHAVREPLSWSAFRVHGELAVLGPAPSRSRLAIPEPLAKDAAWLGRAGELLATLVANRAVLEEPGGHPFGGCKVFAYSHSAADETRHALTQLAAALPAVEQAVAALTAAGVALSPCAVIQWRAAESEARAVLAAPLFPAEWFRADPVAAANAVIELDGATRTARELVAKLPEFAPEALRTPPVDLDAAPASVSLTGTPSAKERLATLERVAAALAALGEQVREAEALAGQVRDALRVPRIGVAQLQEFAALAGRLAARPPLPVSWWDAPRRAELLAAVGRAADDARTAQADRTKLAARLSPVAFARESAAVVREAATAAASTWRWVPWSAWGKARTPVAAWYSVPPDDATLRADVEQLAAYHRRIEAAEQVAAAHRTDLLSPSGVPDWDATLAGLRDTEALDRWKAGPELKARLAAGGSLDRSALATAAQRLAAVAAGFADGWTAILRDLAVPDPAAVLAQTPADVIAWLQTQSAAVSHEAAKLMKIVALLKPGHDVAAANLSERSATLLQLAAARVRIAGAATALGEERASHALEATDHAPAAGTARTLLALLATLNRPVSAKLTATLTDAAARERLRVALDASTAAHAAFDRAWDRLSSELFDVAASVSSNVVVQNTPLPELREWATKLAANVDRLAEWARFAACEREVRAAGLGAVLDEVRAKEYPVSEAAAAFRARFLRLWLDALHQQVPALAAFSTDAHERLIERFGELDRFAVRTAANCVRGHLDATAPRPHSRDSAPESSELGVLMREVAKKRRHLPLRSLFQQIPTLLPRLKPCLMMSPLAVSTYLEDPDLTFDVVIFDEASQVRPHDAICAISRARQLVVGGDPKQLPPTDFFNRSAGDDEDDDPEDRGAGFESLLDVCVSLGLTRKRLRWHYRSRREGLIAFSNRHIYENRLVTFPSADEGTTPAVTFERVAGGRFADGVNPVEARRVAQLVMDHAKHTPTRSLGVIAFSQKQQDRILDELEVLRRQSSEHEGFFADDRPDPFFVKNLENVQGDERDVILLSVGYGPDDSGKVAMRFGPLNQSGGERRLNVAVTRARWAMVVVSSLNANDIDLSRTAAEGAKLLKAFLDYAERGPVALGEMITEANQRAADSPFEREVGDELARRGLVVHRQVGCGSYRIDLAIADPGQGGRYLLGVECDGATYHSAATARDRDRLRHAVLEGLGWRLVRVWSSDWVRDREKQVRRVLAALEAAKHPRPEPREEPAPAPVVVKQRTPPAPEFDNIEAVPEPGVTDAINRALRDFGSMPAEDLIAAVSKRLGFKRTGPKIRERVAEALNAQTAAGRLLVGDDGRVRVAPR